MPSLSIHQSQVPGGHVQDETRHYTDAQGRSHEVVFRAIDSGQGVKTYSLFRDGREIPRLDYGLFMWVYGMNEGQLAAYFELAQ